MRLLFEQIRFHSILSKNSLKYASSAVKQNKKATPATFLFWLIVSCVPQADKQSKAVMFKPDGTRPTLYHQTAPAHIRAEKRRIV